MKPNRLCIKVNQQLTFGVNTQIKEQLKWLIGTGQLQPGDTLPAASQLADSLGLNRNTVNWVYNQLRDEGLVAMQKGRGTQVLGGSATDRLQEERMPMRQLLEGAVKGAKAEGFDLQELFMAGLAYSLLQSGQAAVPPRILFVEDKGHDHYFYRGEIKRVTGLEVRTVFLDDLLAKGVGAVEDARQHDIWVTTLNQAERVKVYMAPLNKKVHVIGATVDPAVLLEMAKLQGDSDVSFVCLGQTGGEWMAQRVREAGIAGIRPEAFGLREREKLEEALGRSAKIYASGAVFPELKKRAPDKVELFRMRLERSSESLLRELAAPGPR